MSLLLLLVAPALADTPDCLPAATWLDRAREDVLAGDFPAVKEALGHAEASFDCAPALPADLARYWLYQGAVAGLTGDDAGARTAFAASRRLAPGGWDSSFGPVLRALWDSAADGASFDMRLDTNADRAWLDGARVETWPNPTPGGLHLVQIRDDRAEVVLGHHFFEVNGPGEITVETGLPQFPAKLPGRRPHPERSWLLAAGSSLVLSGGAATVALWQRGESGTADTIDAVHTHEKAQIVSAWTSVGLAGSSVVLGGVGLGVYIW